MNLDSALKQLRLSALAQTLSVRLQEATANRLSHGEFLELILLDEINVREQRKFARRTLAAEFKALKNLDDFADKALKLAICDVEVPCGNAATEVFSKAGVDASIDSYEPDVKSVLTKVELGEVDAGLVYHSDVLAAGDRIDSIAIPKQFEVVNTYPIVAIKDAANPDGAQDFIDLVLSEDGQAELKKWGFREP